MSASIVKERGIGKGSAHNSSPTQGYTLETATKLLNMALSKTVPQTPYEIWHSKPASYKYLRVWGSPAYIKRSTRESRPLDSMTSRYQACTREMHWSAVKTIVKYLKMNKDMFLIYGGGELILEGSSFQTYGDDAKSQSGFVFKLYGGVVAWKSSKQATTADSTTEAEYIVASEAAKEAHLDKMGLRSIGDWLKVKSEIVRIGDLEARLAYL
ncbi:Retrovirus-related Pol polyprotein from transposon TNT 1-94 [Sesamum angolense]|uniref:Retrovirus-related Pol polyprotein from transposon TNT 1-94 n=1 Tax=Sesamum angolense TaxID=2727404 RepID=A0AAE2BLI8_9LAMI|nr:Retrovirus-related Pol polyprotein from transposon TNT 1-94 [Sesamum angolense]